VYLRVSDGDGADSRNIHAKVQQGLLATLVEVKLPMDAAARQTIATPCHLLPPSARACRFAYRTCNRFKYSSKDKIRPRTMASAS
jgi:hypothetical protein